MLLPQHQFFNVISVFASYSVLAVAIYFCNAQDSFWGKLIAINLCFLFQKSISEWLHEAAHFNLVRDKSINDSLTRFFIAPVFMTTIEAYRSTHFRHHKSSEFFDGKDKETSLYDIDFKKYPLLEFIIIASGFYFVLSFLIVVFPSNPTKMLKKSFFVKLSWLSVYVSFVYFVMSHQFDSFVLFISIYIVSFLSFYSVFTFNRSLNQHSLYPNILILISSMIRSNECFSRIPCQDLGPSSITRDGSKSIVSKLFVASDVMRFHQLHHKYPNLPWRQLKLIYSNSFN